MSSWMVGEKRRESSWLIGATFAGLATGFIAFWLTLVVAYAIIISSAGALVVWLFAKDAMGEDFASHATVIFLVSIVIGVLVGLGSSYGSGVPIALF
jgi:hypothetical protein